MGYSLQGCRELGMTEVMKHIHVMQPLGGGSGAPKTLVLCISVQEEFSERQKNRMLGRVVGRQEGARPRELSGLPFYNERKVRR